MRSLLFAGAIAAAALFATAHQHAPLDQPGLHSLDVAAMQPDAGPAIPPIDSLMLVAIAQDDVPLFAVEPELRGTVDCLQPAEQAKHPVALAIVNRPEAGRMALRV